MKLPQIYTHFSQGQVFTIDEARRKLGTKGNTLRKRLSDLSMRGYISPIRQGLYRLSNLGESRFGKLMNSPYEIASKLTPSCYVGYKTALQLHANQIVPENDKVYVISPTKFNGFTFDTREYIWCQSSENYGIETHIWHGNNREFIVHTTNIEKTLIDCLRRPTNCPTLQDFMNLCQKLQTKPDINKLFIYAKQINIRSVLNRLGYILETQKESWGISDDLLNLLENQMSMKQIDWAIPINKNEKNRWKINFLNSTKTH